MNHRPESMGRGGRAPTRRPGAAILAAALCVSILAACERGPADRVLVLHTANVYGYTEDCGCRFDSTGGLAKRAWVIDSLRRSTRAPVLVVDAGDFSGGDSYYGSALGRVMVEAMELMEYDAFTFGEWDLNLGTAYLREVVERSPVAWVHTNYEIAGLEGLGHPTLVLEKGGRRIGLLGLFNPTILLDPGMRDSVRVEEDVVASARRGVRALRAQGVDAVIVLSHLSYRGDLLLTQHVEGIDLIVSGHGGKSLRTAERASPGTWVVAPGDLGRFLGVADVVFARGDSAGVAGVEGDLIVMEPSLPEDSAVDSLVAQYDREMRQTGPNRRIEGRYFRLREAGPAGESATRTGG